MRSFLSVLLLVLTISWLPYHQCQKFNIFKSYKDATVKPDNYGKVIRKDHPVTEYLDSKQLKMLRERTGPDTADNTFDNHWSGFKDKSLLNQSKQKRKGGGGGGTRKRNMRKVKKNPAEDGDSAEDADETNDRRRMTYTDVFTTSSSPSSSTTFYSLYLPVVIEGSAQQNLFYVTLFGLLFCTVFGMTAYLVFKNLAFFRSKRSIAASNNALRPHHNYNSSSSNHTASTGAFTSSSSAFTPSQTLSLVKKAKEEDRESRLETTAV